MITENPTIVNPKNEQEFEIPGISQAVQSLRQKGQYKDFLCAEILEGSNKTVIKTLEAFGYDIIIPGTAFASLANVAEFYGIPYASLYSLVRRIGISVTKTPNDFVYDKKFHFLNMVGALKKDMYRVVGDHSIVLTHGEDGTEYNVKGFNRQTAFISARVVLAVAAQISSIRSNTAANIYKALGSTAFARRAVAKFDEIKKPEKSASKKRKEVPAKAKVDSSHAEYTNGSFVLTPDFFATVIKTAVREAVSESVKQMTMVRPEAPKPKKETKPKGEKPKKEEPKAEKKRGPRAKLTQPDNWDDIVAQQIRGDITASQACFALGMSVSTYHKYKSGKAKFAPTPVPAQ